MKPTLFQKILFLCAGELVIAGMILAFRDRDAVVVIGVIALFSILMAALWLFYSTLSHIQKIRDVALRISQGDYRVQKIPAEENREFARTLEIWNSIAEKLKSHDMHLNQKVYQSAILKEISERISSSLDVGEIMEIISGSLGAIVPYSAVSYMMLEKEGKILFKCHIEESVGKPFVTEVRQKMLALIHVLVDTRLKDEDIKTVYFGTMFDESSTEPVRSFFNVPMIVNGEVVGIINAASTRPDAYREEETKILYSIAEQAGSTISKITSLIHEETNKIHSMLASVSEGIVMVNQREQVVIINKQAKEILGLEKKDGEVLLLDIIQSLYGKFDFRGLGDQVRQSDTAHTFPELLLGKTYYKVTATPVKDTSNRMIGIVFVFSDITKEKEVDKMKSEFISITSHQLRTPLSSMKWFLEMLVNGDIGPLEEKQKSVITDIYNSNERIIMLVNDLLDVSRMESGKVMLEPTPTNLIEFFKSMLPEVSQNFTKRKQTFEFEKPDALPRIAIDPRLIWQAISNLLTNASKYTPDGGHVTLKLSLESRAILIQVVDNGYGVPEFQKDRIFEKFFRADNTAKQEGTGLGLYIVKEIIEASGGMIWFESMEGKGSTFSITLPLEGSKPRPLSAN